ncbi:Yos1-like protein [Cladorrhinum sp. PSN332]|nr:Yos1-like protein [Cladorrhinum sp. PSN332]
MAILGTLIYVNLTPETHRRNFGDNPDSSVKYRTIQLVSSIRTLARIPLIIVNTLIMLYELVLG